MTTHIKLECINGKFKQYLSMEAYENPIELLCFIGLMEDLTVLLC